ncbi:MAG: hypothetical protein ACHP7O_06090 [Burkholderiales bacterium]
MTRHMQRPSMRLSRRHERWIYATGGILFFSGIGWLIFHYFFAGTNEFGVARHPSEPWWLRLHGAAAMGFLVAIGSLLPGHIVRAWHLRKNYRSGVLILALVVALILTGYCLYYLGDEQSRPWISMAHWAVGIVSGLGFLLHVWLGKRKLPAQVRIVPSSPGISGNTPHSPPKKK